MTEFSRWNTGDSEARRLRIQQEFERILVHLDPMSGRKGTKETPERVAKMWVDELCSGYLIDPKDVFKIFEGEKYNGMVIVKDIPFTSTCEHHLVPFVGYAHVGYLPNGGVVGLSKIKRLIDIFAKRLQIQERLTQQIADTMAELLEARGVMIVMEAEHLCMTIRGVQSPGTKTVTSAVTGLYNTNEEGEKEEFLRLIGK